MGGNDDYLGNYFKDSGYIASKEMGRLCMVKGHGL
jgi:hypothetical protein